MDGTLINIPTWVIAVFAGFAAVWGVYKDYNDNRPTIAFEKLALDANQVKVYAGTEVDWKDVDGRINDTINDAEKGSYFDIVKKSDKLHMISWLRPNDHLLPDKQDKTYMFINLCPREDIENKSESVVLVLGALIITLKLEKKKIQKFKVSRIYSMKDGKTSHGKGLKINIEPRVSELKPVFEMQVAYACIVEDKTIQASLHLEKINEFKNENKVVGKIIDFSINQTDANNYIGFEKTAYLIKYHAKKRPFYPYYYSIFIDKTNNSINPVDESGGPWLFYAKAIQAWWGVVKNRKSIIGSNVIQKSVKTRPTEKSAK